MKDSSEQSLDRETVKIQILPDDEPSPLTELQQPEAEATDKVRPKVVKRGQRKVHPKPIDETDHDVSSRPLNKNESRKRLSELKMISDKDRTEAIWDEIIELEIQLAPGNRVLKNNESGESKLNHPNRSSSKKTSGIAGRRRRGNNNSNNPS